MVISRDWIIRSSGDSGAIHEVAMGDADLDDEILDGGIPQFLENFTRNLIVLNPKSEDEKLIKQVADVHEEA